MNLRLLIYYDDNVLATYHANTFHFRALVVPRPSGSHLKAIPKRRPHTRWQSLNGFRTSDWFTIPSLSFEPLCVHGSIT